MPGKFARGSVTVYQYAFLEIKESLFTTHNDLAWKRKPAALQGRHYPDCKPQINLAKKAYLA